VVARAFLDGVGRRHVVAAAIEQYPGKQAHSRCTTETIAVLVYPAVLPIAMPNSTVARLSDAFSMARLPRDRKIRTKALGRSKIENYDKEVTLCSILGRRDCYDYDLRDVVEEKMRSYFGVVLSYPQCYITERVG
jgi:hypothetical protein